MKNAACPEREHIVEGFHLTLKPANIFDIVCKVTAQIQPMVHSRNQSFTLNLTPPLPEIIADSLRIEQILLHLLCNAIKFTPCGGNIFLSASSDSSFVFIEVTGSGPSILPENPQEIFQPHYRLKDTTETDSPGIGLGLALCKYLVELHGGQIWAESGQGKGNTFAFSLPI